MVDFAIIFGTTVLGGCIGYLIAFSQYYDEK